MKEKRSKRTIPDTSKIKTGAKISWVLHKQVAEIILDSLWHYFLLQQRFGTPQCHTLGKRKL